MRKHTFYEFFAGGGMAREGLGDEWQCLFANDFDAKKVEAYKANWGGGEIVCGDIHKLAVSSLPGQADLAWASFPCQDLSLAGNGAGLKGERSGAFWGFWQLINGLKAERRRYCCS
jgi:DNA (cytosine-5)-methyltransferase 1